MTTAQSPLVTRHLQRQSVAILSKPACIWRFDERDRNIGALHLGEIVSRHDHLNALSFHRPAVAIVKTSVCYDGLTG